MNDIKGRINEIEAGGVDEKKKLLELEAAIAKFETIRHPSNEEVKTLPPLQPRSPIEAALNFGAEKYTSIPVPALAIYACPHNWDRFPASDLSLKAALVADDIAPRIALSSVAQPAAEDMYRALSSCILCVVVTIGVGLLTAPKSDSELNGLV